MTNQRILNKGIKFVAEASPALRPHIEARPKFDLLPKPHDPVTYFQDLAYSVLGQQISVAAALSIKGRLNAEMGGKLTPRKILNRSDSDLRACGLSGAKVRTIQGLATAYLDKSINYAHLPELDDEEIIREMTQVWGIGRWTVEMFLMFTLGRLDVWPVGDLGVRKGFAVAHGLDETPTEKQIAPLGDPFGPYRSIAAWYCWRVLEPEERWS